MKLYLLLGVFTLFTLNYAAKDITEKTVVGHLHDHLDCRDNLVLFLLSIAVLLAYLAYPLVVLFCVSYAWDKLRTFKIKTLVLFHLWITSIVTSQKGRS